MRVNTLQLTRAVSAVLVVLLLSAVGMTKALAQSFTVGDLNYSVNSDGITVTVTGHVNGTAATGELVIPETVIYNESTYSVTTIGTEAFRGSTGFTGNLVIPNSVTSIGSSAFYYCTGFTGNLVIPNSVATIGEYAFCYCTGFTGNFVIPNSMTFIDSYAFAECYGFTGNLDIPNSVTFIGNYAFKNCTGFNGNLVIPNSVTSIGGGAFSGCYGFTGNLVIPNSVTTIGGGAFSGCYGFTGNLDIPNSVASIGDYAFNGCTGFTGNLDIPNSVTTIGGGAFSGCTGFTGDLVIPNSVTFIGESAFRFCSGFTGSLIIPNSVTFIGGYAFNWIDFYSVEYNATNCANGYPDYPPFHGCGGTLVIGENVERIPANMFRNAAFTGSLIIPNSVTSIGGGAFCYCTGFTGDLVIPNSVTSIGNSAFDGCTGFYSVEYDATDCADASLEYPPFQNCGAQLIIGENVEHIPANMFRSAAFTLILSHAEMPPTIGTDAFYGIVNDISVYVPCGSLSDYQNAEGWNEFTNIFGNSFEITVGDLNYYVNCDGTTVTVTGHVDGQSATGELVIPETVTYNGSTYSVTAIRSSAFSGCSGFTGNLIIPNSVTTIGIAAFRGCNGFTGNLVIPNSVTTIGSYAFRECSGFTGNLIIPNSVTTIEEWAFANCGFTGNLVIANSVTSIGSYAFYDCYRFNGNLVIPNSVTSIGGGAFCYCTGFTGDLVIPNSVTTIGDYAFYDCTGFTGNLVIPNSVTTINDCAFCYCNGFTGNLVIPNSVTTIGGSAFYYCSGFNGNLTIGSSVTTIGSSAFNGCTGFIGNLVIPNSVTTIGSYAFRGCTGFNGNLTIGNSVTTIGSVAFSGCSGFTGNLVIPNSVTSIGIGAFEGCSGFTGNLVIANSVASIGDYAFNGCTGFNGNLTIGNSVTTIGIAAFRGCTGFTGNLVIPNSVTFIGESAFSGCYGFSFVEYNATDCADASSSWPPFQNCGGTLTIAGNVKRIPANMFRSAAFPLILCHAEMPPTVSTDAFYGIDHDIPVYVPCGSLSNYQNAGGWNEFNNIFECFEIKEITVTVSPANSGTVTGAGTYELGTTCTLTATANPGYTFINWKENGIQVSFDANYSFTVTGDRNLVANFALPFTITATAEPAEGGTVSGAGEYDYGTKCTLTAIPNDGYYFVKWTQNGTEVSRHAMYSFTVTTERDLVANFAINPISQVVAAYYPDASNPASPNVRVQWNYGGDSVVHHFRIYRTKCDDSSPYILMTDEEYNNWFVDTTWSHIAGGNYKYGVSCVYEDGKEGDINWSIYNKDHNIHETRPSKNNYPVEGTSAGRAPYCIIPENTNLPIFRNQNTDCIIAQNGRDFGHFALNNPSEVTLYGFSIDAFTNGACFMNGTYYFSTITYSNNSGIFGTFNSESGLTVIATGRPFGQIEYNPVDGKLYGLNIGSDATLYEVNPFDGSYTAIADISTSYVLTFTITNEGRFIVCDAGDECIKEYNLATGELTPLIYVDWNINFGQDMAMDRETNEVYWAAYNASNSSAPLIKIDLSNNTLLTIGYFEDQVAAFANATTYLQGYPPVWSNCIENVLSLCSLTIEMYDSWGDGWNGNKLTVSDDFGDYYEVTLDNGSSGITTLPVPDGSHITLGWIMGNYTSECSFNVRYPNGDLIYHGENMSSNFSFEFDMDCMEIGGDDHEYIDLGLPSGLLWATCNVGANVPDQYGDYFAWGETQPKDVYNWDTYQYYDGGNLTKYTGSDGLTILLPEDDAATANWGNGWRMPTKEEWQELLDNTTYTWTTQNGVNGYLFTAPNGSSLFLPAAGYRWDGGFRFVGSTGLYWSSSLDTGNPLYAWYFGFDSYHYLMDNHNRYYGLSVRAVRSASPVLSYIITAMANPTEGGTVSGAGTYEMSTTCTLTATANAGYTFINWTENGEVVSTEAEYSFTVTGDRDLVANFSQNTYTISALAIPSNSGSVSGAGNYYYGDTCTLTATANTGYNFVHWTKNGTHVSTNATYSFTVTENASCVAYFRVTSYTISASANPTEGGTVSGGGTFNHGSTCTLTATANEDYTFVNWTENGEVVSTSAIYSFTVTGSGTYVANFTSDSGGYYWTVNVNQYPNTMTAIGVILIDDVEQMTNTLELGAFCGTECRGRERLAYISQIDRYLLFLTMYGDNGDELNFRLYDHALGQELDVICTNSVTFATNNTLGTVVSPYEFSFMEGIQTQTSSLPEGWSWWSTYIEQEGIDGLTQLENSLGENGVMIKSQSEGFTSRYGEYWFGLLNSINNESSYLVQTSGSCDVSLTGHVAVPSEHPITLLPGWTWIGYPNNTAMSVSTALSNLNPSENDMLKAQESFSVYYPSIGWFGSLQTIMPGMGLMYESHNTSSVTLTYSNPTRTDNLAENVTARTNHWNPDVYAYPNNMNVMAVVEVNGEELQSEDYELAAFANGECRGSAKLMYVEQLHRYMVFLTLHGDDETELSFGLYDNATGMTAYKSDARLIFTANAVAGSPDNPMVVSFSDMTGIDSFGGTLHVFPNPVERGSMITIGTVEENIEVRVEIMNAVGAVLYTETSTRLPANIKAPEVPGVYMLRISSKGRGIRYVKLIVS